MRLAISLISILLVFYVLNAESVKNPDKPIKGQWQFSPQKMWETDSAGDDILVEIPCMILGDEGNTYVLDSRRNKIHAFNSQGKHKLSFARKGEGPGEIKEAYDFYMDKNMVMVPDGTKVHYFTKKGEYKKSIKTPEMLLHYLFLDEHRTVAIPFSSVVLRDKTRPRDVFLYNLSTGLKKKLFDVPRVKALRYSGSSMRLMLKMPDIVHEELFMAMYQKGFTYGYSDTYTLHQLNNTGKEIRAVSLQGRARQAVSLEDKKIILKKTMEKHKNIPKNVLESITDQIPDLLPHFHQIHAEKNGLLYVLISVVKKPNQREVDIFSGKGKYLYRGQIVLDENFAIIRLRVKGKNLVAFIEDEEGERKLVGYTINIPK